MTDPAQAPEPLSDEELRAWRRNGNQWDGVYVRNQLGRFIATIDSLKAENQELRRRVERLRTALEQIATEKANGIRTLGAVVASKALHPPVGEPE
jgi:hypothetical protein